METQAQIKSSDNHPTASHLYFNVACQLLVAVSMGWLVWKELHEALLAESRGDGMSMTLDYQRHAEKREPFTVIVQVKNSGNQVRHVESIGLSRGALAVDFWDTEPHYKSQDDDRSGKIFAFDIAVPPGQSVNVSLKGIATVPGSFDGNIEVLIAESLSIHKLPLHITIRDTKLTPHHADSASSKAA